jgi:hypothetical protein
MESRSSIGQLQRRIATPLTHVLKLLSALATTPLPLPLTSQTPTHSHLASNPLSPTITSRESSEPDTPELGVWRNCTVPGSMSSLATRKACRG